MVSNFISYRVHSHWRHPLTWNRSLNGRHTGKTELSLTGNGEKRIRATGKALVGEDRLICPTELAHV